MLPGGENSQQLVATGRNMRDALPGEQYQTGSGEYKTKPMLITGIAPGVKKATNAKEALQMVQAMKAKKLSNVKSINKPKVVEIPTDIESSHLSRSGKSNINAFLSQVPEHERQPIINELLKKQDFWEMYGDGRLNPAPRSISSILSAIRGKLGFLENGPRVRKVNYPKRQWGTALGPIEDATRRTVGHQRTTHLKPD